MDKLIELGKVSEETKGTKGFYLLTDPANGKKRNYTLS